MSGLSGLSALSGMPAIFGGIEYLLHDEFTTARLAGAVNGTAAEPGGTGGAALNTRTVTDTESKLTIASGALTFAGGKAVPAYGDPGLWYGAVTRAAGRVLLVNYTYTGGTTVRVGWDTNQAGPVSDGLYVGNGNLAAIVGGISVAVGAPLVTSTTYRLGCILKATGMYLLIKGGIYTNWALLWIAPTVNTTPMYPGTSNFDIVGTPDSFRIPVSLWLPTPIAYDTFTRANGALGNSETTGPDAQAVTARAWTGATWTIATNAAINTPTEGGELAAGNLTIGTWYRITATEVNHFYVGCAIDDTFRATGATALDANNKVVPFTISELLASLTDAATSNVKVRAQVGALTAKKQCGMVARLDNATTPQNFIIMYFDGAGNVKVEEMVAGTWAATVLSVVKAFTASDWLELDLSGTAYRAYHITNAGIATLLGSGTIQTTTGPLHGLFSTYASNTVLGMEVWPKGTGNEYSRLDAF